MTAHRPTFFVAVAAVLLVSPSALGEETALEQVVVRNRLHSVKGKLEVSADAGMTFLNRLTEHYDFNLGVAYNLSERFGIEVRGGYAVSGQTGLARQVAGNLLARAPVGENAEVVTVNDLSNLWEMKGNVIAGVRWAPLYGKISLLAEAPVHYQAYLWAGAGAATLHRQSVVFCRAVTDRASGTCGDWLTADRAAVVGSGAFGMRFFVGSHGAIRAEVRDYLFKDSYLVNVNRSVSEAGGSTGQPAPRPGLTHLVLIDVGYTFFF